MGYRVLLTLAFPPQPGGMQRHMAQWVCRSPGQYVVSAPFWPGAERWDAFQPFPVARWRIGPRGPWGGRRFLQVEEALRSLQKIRRRYPVKDLELGQVLPFGIVALWAQRVWGYPYDVWIFGDEFLKAIRFPLFRGLTRVIVQRARFVYAISRYSAHLALSLGGGGLRVKVVRPWPASIFEPGDRRKARRALGVEEDAMVLLTVARLEPRKGVDRVLHVLPRLVETFPRLRYVVIGEGSARVRWMAMGDALGVADRVVWTGWVPDTLLVQWYQAADLFVLIPTPGPQEVEGFGLVFVEAAACALPAVAGDNGGVREAVLDGRTGFVVPPDDADALYTALTTLLSDDDLRRTMGRAAREHAFHLRQAVALRLKGDGA